MLYKQTVEKTVSALSASHSKKEVIIQHCYVQYIEVKCDVIEKSSQGASDGRCQTVFVSKSCMSRGRSKDI